jgi:Ca-activated chloride channel family protein
MRCEDVYPNRLTFSKNKFNDLLKNLKDEKIGVLGFSSRSFLIAPITNDYSTLQYLVNNLSQDSVNIQGSDILAALETTNELLENQAKKALIIFTDGTDTKEFTKSIQYAKENKIKVFVYAVATQKGGLINTQSGEVQKDSNGNIVITSLNQNIKELALQSTGAYLEYSSNTIDIKEFIDAIRSKFKSKSKENIEINTNEELFYIPLSISLIFFLIAISSFRRKS